MYVVTVEMEMANGSFETKTFKCATYDKACTLEARWEGTADRVSVVEWDAPSDYVKVAYTDAFREQDPSDHMPPMVQWERTTYRIDNPHWVADIRSSDERREQFVEWFETEVSGTHDCIVEITLRNRPDCVLVDVVEA